MNDELLSKLRKEPRPEFAEALYQKLDRSHPAGHLPAILHTPALIVPALALLIAAIFFGPSALAFAGGIVRQVGGYMFVEGNQPINLGGTAGPIGIYQSPNSVKIETTGYVPSAADPVQAGKLAGFTVLVPSYLPARYTPMSGWLITSENSGQVVTNGYRDSTNHFLVINQWKVGGGAQRSYSRDTIVDVTVRGQSGVWLPDTVNHPAGKNALVWQENGITYSLITDSLPLDEVLKVAESLGPEGRAGYAIRSPRHAPRLGSAADFFFGIFRRNAGG